MAPVIGGIASIRRRPVRAGTIGLAAAIVLAAGFYFARGSGSDYTKYSNDFNVYYFAAREFLSGRDPYQNRLTPWTPYLYSPVLAELLAPIALLPLQMASYIWFVVSVMSMLVAARTAAILSVPDGPEGVLRNSSAGNASGSGGDCGDGTLSAVASRVSRNADLLRELTDVGDAREAVIAAVGITVVGRFALDCFAMGQVNAIIAFLVVGHLYLYARGRHRLSTVALALAVALKLTPAVLIIYHLAKGRVRFAIVTSMLVGCLLAGSFLVFGRGATGAFAAFRQQTIANGQGFDLAYCGNQSIRAAQLRLTAEWDESRRNPVDILSLGLSLMFLGGALVAARLHNVEGAAAAPIFCCMVVLSPLAWKSHFVAMLLPAAFLAARIVGQASSLSSSAEPHGTGDVTERPEVMEAGAGHLVGTDAAVAQGPGFIRRVQRLAILAAFALFTLTSPTLIGARAAEWADCHSLVLGGALITYIAVLF